MAVVDRFIRFVVAIVLVTLFFTNDYSLAVNSMLLTVAGIFILTAVIGRCPLYALLGVDTRQYKY